MQLIDGIKTRRSVRKFEDKKVPHEVLEQIVEAAAFAPSWKNSQTVRYIAVEDAALKERIATEATMNFTHNKDQERHEALGIRVRDVLTDLELVHDADGIFDRRDRTVVHIRRGKHHVTQSRRLETMAILFVLRDGITSVVTVRQPRAAIIEIIILDTHVFERLSTQVHPRMASSAFILLKQFVACDLLGSQSRLVTHQILVEAARREQRLFKLGDSIGNRRLVETFRIHFEETFAQLLVFRQLWQHLSDS